MPGFRNLAFLSLIKIFYLYTTLNVCVALFEAVLTELTLIVTMHHNCLGSPDTLAFTGDVVLFTLLLVPTLLPLASSFVLTSTFIPEAGMAELSVTAKFNEGPGFKTLLPALWVKAIGCSDGGGGGAGLFELQALINTLKNITRIKLSL